MEKKKRQFITFSLYGNTPPPTIITPNPGRHELNNKGKGLLN